MCPNWNISYNAKKPCIARARSTDDSGHGVRPNVCACHPQQPTQYQQYLFVSHEEKYGSSPCFHASRWSTLHTGPRTQILWSKIGFDLGCFDNSNDRIFHLETLGTLDATLIVVVPRFDLCSNNGKYAIYQLLYPLRHPWSNDFCSSERNIKEKSKVKDATEVREYH